MVVRDLGVVDDPARVGQLREVELADLGAFLGAAFIVLVPILLKNIMVGGMGFDSGMAGHVEILLMGMLIIFFLIVEPHGLARLWQIAKEKLRLWPFPH